MDRTTSSSPVSHASPFSFRISSDGTMTKLLSDSDSVSDTELLNFSAVGKSLVAFVAISIN